MYICLKLGTCRWLIVIIEPKADFRRAAFSPQSLILVFLATSSLVYSFLMFRGKQFWKLITFSCSKGGQLLNMCRQNSHPSVIILISAFSHFSQTDRTKFLLLYKFIQSIIRIKLSILTRKNIVNLLRGSGLLLSGMTLEFPAFYNNLFSLCPNIVPL